MRVLLAVLAVAAVAVVAQTPSHTMGEKVKKLVSPFLVNKEGENVAKTLATQCCNKWNISAMVGETQSTLMNALENKLRVAKLLPVLTNCNNCLQKIDKKSDLFSEIKAMKPCFVQKLQKMHDLATAKIKPALSCKDDKNLNPMINAALPELNAKKLEGIFECTTKLLSKPKMACLKTYASGVINFSHAKNL